MGGPMASLKKSVCQVLAVEPAPKSIQVSETHRGPGPKFETQVPARVIRLLTLTGIN
jgi:hypothetical protein